MCRAAISNSVPVKSGGRDTCESTPCVSCTISQVRGREGGQSRTQETDGRKAARDNGGFLFSTPHPRSAVDRQGGLFWENCPRNGSRIQSNEVCRAREYACKPKSQPTPLSFSFLSFTFSLVYCIEAALTCVALAVMLDIILALLAVRSFLL